MLQMRVHRNHAMEGYNLYPTRCDWHENFIMLQTEYIIHASQSKWNIFCIFMDMISKFLYHRCDIYLYLALMHVTSDITSQYDDCYGDNGRKSVDQS